MIIQFQSKKTDKYVVESPALLDTYNKLNKPMARTITSMNNGKTVRISLPNKSGTHRGIKYNPTFSEGNSQTQTDSADQSANVPIFKPAFSPRRTYGNIRFLLEVMHKKVRAKAIESTFQHCNYKLDMSLEMNKGFKGRKVAQNSLFHTRTQQKMRAKSLQQKTNLSKKTQNHILLSERTQKLSHYLKTPKQHQKPTKQAKILYDQQTVRKNTNKSNTAGASLNIYRKRFKQMKKIRLEQNKDEDIAFGFLG